jgi:tRNA(Ile)-lysidine synthetase-like protein
MIYSGILKLKIDYFFYYKNYLMNNFYQDWISREKYWFNQNDDNDKYLSDTYSYLIDTYSYEIYEKPILGILIYDQLTRHYYRNEYNNHILIYFNQKALEIANKYKNELFIKSLCYNDWMFYMLVYRHSNIRENLLFVMNECWKLEKLPIKFIKATYNRANFKEELDIYKNILVNFDLSILDNYSENEILSDQLYKIGNFDNIESDIIIISLSGGVDSVVCLFNLVKKYPLKKIKAVHINYNNRIEVEEEVKFLRCLCCLFNIELYVRKINEINRHKCMCNDLRDIYESYTKKVRFNSYKYFGELPTVILGHNKDDCFENILTNIAYNSKYENLLGIEYSSVIDNIKFIRPLINVSKNDIYKFAITHNLPYLKNSTPEWSQRGKIRNNILPVLMNWDYRIIDGLFNLSDVLKNYNEILKILIDKFDNTEIDLINNLNISKLYWKHGLYKLFNIYISNKALVALVERLQLWKEKYNKMDINKKTNIIVSNKFMIIIIKRKNDYYEINRKLL